MIGQNIVHISSLSAQGKLSRAQQYGLLAILLLMVVSLAVQPLVTLSVAVSVIITVVFLSGLLLLFIMSKSGGGQVNLQDEHRQQWAKDSNPGLTVNEAGLLADAHCGMYRVVLPVRGEMEVIAQQQAHMAKLDYPKDKLQIVIVVDEGDNDTIAAVAALTLPSNTYVVTVPKAAYGPERGKPKSMLWACRHLRSMEGVSLPTPDYFVIWDGEDLPEVDQLRKAATAFTLYPEVECLQAVLCWHNANQNWYTRMVQGVYASHFQLKLRGLAALGWVFPLGGTSNHLRYQTLETLGFWDPFNVTEDLDLGIKLSRAGAVCMMLPSLTWEEATCTFRTQYKQASRWFKGHSVTAAVHLRSPRQLYADLGLWRTLSFLVVVGFSHPAMMTASSFWILAGTYLLTQSEVIHQLTPGLIYYVGSVCFLANISFVWVAMLACIRSGQAKLCPWMLTLPLYWLTVLTVASFKAAKELLIGDWYSWDKTAHGAVKPVRQPQHGSVAAEESSLVTGSYAD